MKNIKNTKNTGFLKKVFIKICRKLGFEIIDQNTFDIVTSGKRINDDLSLIGQNSINLPLGKIKITRQVKALDIIIRTCASVNMLTQSKSRLFEKEKILLAKKCIRDSRFIELQREINRHKNLTKKTKLKITQTIDGLLRILKKYPLEDVNVTKSISDETIPEIIISESYN